jgi:GntR family transcriptional regulator
MANPMYRQIAEDLRERIESGQFERGQQLETEIELRERYGASRNTIRDAIKLLTTRGLVETRPGQGTFVVKKIEPYVTRLNTDPKTGPGGDITTVYGEAPTHDSPGEKKRVVHSTDPRVEIQNAPEAIAFLLQVREGSSVVSRHQKRYINGTPWSLQTSFYPMEFVLNGADRLMQAEDIKLGTVKYLAATLDLQQVGYRDWITVRAPDATEAIFFNLPQDGRIGVFEIRRTAFDQKSKPMRLTVSVFPTDRNEFVLDVGDVPGIPSH